MQAYGRIQSTVNGIGRPRKNEVAAETAATQTEADEAAAADLYKSDEQALDDLAQADLAYLEMVRHKLGQSAGVNLTSSAEDALAESWQQLIMLRRGPWCQEHAHQGALLDGAPLS